MSAKPQVTFQTDFLQLVPGEEEETDPGRYGKALAQWLAESLKERGVNRTCAKSRAVRLLRTLGSSLNV